MNKILAALVGILLVANIAQANDREQFSVGQLTVETSIVNNGTTTSTGAETATARKTLNGGATISDPLILTAGAASVTNGQEVTVSEPVHVLTGTGGANDTTNVITLANCSAALVGQQFSLIVEATSTNLIGLADSGNLKLSAAFNGDNNDAITLYAVATNSFVELTRSDN